MTDREGESVSLKLLFLESFVLLSSKLEVMSRKRVVALAAAAFASVFFLAFYVYHSRSPPSSLWRSSQSHQQASKPPIHDRINQGVEQRVYATLLTTRITDLHQDDHYFTAVRVLCYQLLHQPDTRTNLSIPFVVFVTPHVSAEKRTILVEEGATVLPLSLLEPESNWVNPGEERFIDQFTKLRLFEQTQYERILYLDADMLLMRCLDGIWDEPVAQRVYKTLAASDFSSLPPDSNAAIPSNYTIVGVSDTGGANHAFPPLPKSDMNGGFFLLRPSIPLFNYYVSILNTPNAFDSGLMEQALLNYAHKKEGRMPWKSFQPGKWNVNWPRLRDIEGGAATLHDKFWDSRNEGWIERVLIEKWWRVQGQMEGFWLARRDMT
jgi:alpha-N-acetylglucosamine transferase